MGVLKRLINRFRCHQWMPSTCVCKRCGVTREEIMRHRSDHWPDDARGAVARLSVETRFDIDAAPEEKRDILTLGEPDA